MAQKHVINKIRKAKMRDNFIQDKICNEIFNNIKLQTYKNKIRFTTKLFNRKKNNYFS